MTRRPSTRGRILERVRAGASVSLVSVLFLLAGVGLTVVTTVKLRHDQARSHADQLAEHARQAARLFSTVSQGLDTLLTSGGVVADSTAGSPQAFAAEIRPRLVPTRLANAVLFELAGGRLHEVTWTGRAKPVLVPRFTSADRARLRLAARTGKLLVVTRGQGADAALLGIATAAHPGSRYLVYGEVSIPSAGIVSGVKGFQFAFYLGRESPRSLLLSNVQNLPIRGRRVVVPLAVAGLAEDPVLVYRATDPLTFASASPWIVLTFGLLISLVVAGQYEAVRRRRDTALGLVDDLELKNAELDRQSAINRHQALHDGLTGLPNRTLFRDRIDLEVRRSIRSGRQAAVILIDLDRFKEINDTLGHGSGDLLLQTLSERLASTIRASDTVARLGGDEFGVLIGAVTDLDDVLAIADKLRTALSGPADVAGLAVEVDASVGIALYPEHGADVDALMRHADIALYRSKAVHAPAVYSSEEDHYSPVRLQLLGDLRHAIDDGQIVVYYQPQAPTSTGTIESVEALVRWQHPELGLVPPIQFIPLAEQTGMIRPLTRHVLATALAQCRTWLDRGWHIGVAVNVCARDLLDSGFPAEVLDCLEATGVDPEMLELEITEDTILTDAVRALDVIEELRAHGVRFAIDDFGAGQSSLSYLKRLPVQVLKIDKSFVLGMTDNADDAVIVSSTINLGHNLRLKVVAEGVENAEIWGQLADLDCDTIQGFELGHPLPSNEVEKLFTPLPGGHSQASLVVPRVLPQAG